MGIIIEQYNRFARIHKELQMNPWGWSCHSYNDRCSKNSLVEYEDNFTYPLKKKKKKSIAFPIPIEYIEYEEACFVWLYIDSNDVNAINMSGRSLYHIAWKLETVIAFLGWN